MGTVIKRLDSVLGVRFWRQDFVNRAPRYEVFRVVGVDPVSGAYYFQSVTEKSIIARTLFQLKTNGFHPFLIEQQVAQEESQNATV